MALANIPLSQLVDEKGFVTRAWQQYFLNPSVQQINISSAIGVTSGGTGLTTVPGVGQFLIGNGTTYSLVAALPASAFPILTGDVTTPGGSLATVLATVNGAPGSYGASNSVATYTVNGKGLVTSSGSVGIAGAPAAFTVVGPFGCNSKSAQTSVSSGAAVATTAATNVAPYGYTTAAQADRIVALLNVIQAALIANGTLT